MLIIPAIDLKDGACVRLRQGLMDDATVFSDDPVAMAAKWVEAGCRRLHLVDLNGAFEGKPVNGEVVTAIARRYPNLPIQIGGGIRSLETIEHYVRAGVSYVIIGTKAVKQPEFVGEACRAFDAPVTGGNVSFYNHTVTEKRNIPVFPTPTIGMVGLVPDVNKRMSLDFKVKGDLIYLLGKSVENIASSEYLVRHHKIQRSPAPYFDLDEERRLHTMLLMLIRKGLITAAHDASDGGLWVTLVEMALPRGLGFDVVTDSDIRPDAFLFGEAQGRAVVTVNEDNETAFLDLLQASKVPFLLLGHVTKGKLMVDDESFGFIEDARKVYEEAIPKVMPLTMCSVVPATQWAVVEAPIPTNPSPK